jgi:hypothetical protein
MKQGMIKKTDARKITVERSLRAAVPLLVSILPTPNTLSNILIASSY